MSVQWRAGGARVVARATNKVLHFEFTGPITDAVIGALSPASALPFNCDRLAYAVVMRFDKALLLTSAETLTRALALVSAEPGPMRLPTALVVAPHDVDLAVEHCRQAAELGVIRACFARPASASSWARDYAERAQAWHRHAEPPWLLLPFVPRARIAHAADAAANPPGFRPSTVRHRSPRKSAAPPFEV